MKKLFLFAVVVFTIGISSHLLAQRGGPPGTPNGRAVPRDPITCESIYDASVNRAYARLFFSGDRNQWEIDMQTASDALAECRAQL